MPPIKTTFPFYLTTGVVSYTLTGSAFCLFLIIPLRHTLHPSSNNTMQLLQYTLQAPETTRGHNKMRHARMRSQRLVNPCQAT